MRQALTAIVATAFLALLGACDVSGRGSTDHPPPEIMPSSSERPPEAEVRAMVEARYPGARYAWRKLEIEDARRPMPYETEAAHLPADVIVWLVFTNFTETTFDGERDIRRHFYLYKAHDGRWTLVTAGLLGDHESDLRAPSQGEGKK
jgi:hypothetical protein